MPGLRPGRATFYPFSSRFAKPRSSRPAGHTGERFEPAPAPDPGLRPGRRAGRVRQGGPGSVREVCSRPESAALRERDDAVQDRILRRLRIRTRSAPCERQVLSNRRRRGRARQELGRGVRDHARRRTRPFEEGVRAFPDAGRSGVDCGPPGATAFCSASCAGCAWRAISGESGPKARVRGAVRVQIGMLRQSLKPEIEQNGSRPETDVSGNGCLETGT